MGGTPESLARAEAVRAGVGSCPRQPEGPRDPTPGRAGTRAERLLSGPWRLEGPVLRREREGEGRGDRGNVPASLPASINHRSRGGRRAGKCTEPERSVVAPDTSLSPVAGFLSFSVLCLFVCFCFFKPPPLPPRSGGCPSIAARSPLLLRGCSRPPSPPPPPRSAGTRGKRKLGVSACQPRGRAPGADAAVLPAARRTAGAAPAPGSRGRLGRPLPLPPRPPEPGDGGRPRSRAVAGRPLSSGAAAALRGGCRRARKFCRVRGAGPGRTSRSSLPASRRLEPVGGEWG